MTAHIMIATSKRNPALIQILIGRTSLDLQPYWPRVTDAFLFGVLARCTNLRSLGLSWCGGGLGLLTESGFCTFLSVTGSKLQCLRLASCSFMSDDCMKTIAGLCPRLVDLDVQCCLRLTGDGIVEVARLPMLRRLNLQNTRATTESVLAVVTACGALEHVNLGHCSDIAGNDWDTLVISLATHCPHLKSVDLWRARTLTHIGVAALAENCPELISLNLGWCRSVESDLCVPQLAERCPRLRKLFLTAIRNVNDDCVAALTEHCTELEQLDVLGSTFITPRSVAALVAKCTHLRLLDVSFCSLIDTAVVDALLRSAPRLAVKKD
jgi:F-box/leucine-rich repeat protein 4